MEAMSGHTMHAIIFLVSRASSSRVKRMHQHVEVSV